MPSLGCSGTAGQFAGRAAGGFPSSRCSGCRCRTLNSNPPTGRTYGSVQVLFTARARTPQGAALRTAARSTHFLFSFPASDTAAPPEDATPAAGTLRAQPLYLYATLSHLTLPAPPVDTVRCTMAYPARYARWHCCLLNICARRRTRTGIPRASLPHSAILILPPLPRRGANTAPRTRCQTHRLRTPHPDYTGHTFTADFFAPWTGRLPRC